ncbi:beta-3-deoxy-D-manno-oct-2-ulosonic acid transferase [Methylopila sp. M107]|uniref:capsular polysaccharide export protein, LipB/KpsS family n=1 Tax=Methylopila sp. M107 TaxID=1101190 RepID=UPI00036DEE61|nr:beta-3-deoxy-D-manno-oct-2-ulosonic acid transferase [Methylopila sp. M107]
MLPAGFDPEDPAIVWLDPYRRKVVTAWRGIEIAGDVLRHRARTARRAFAVGVTGWKRPIVTAFLDGPNGPPHFTRDPEEAARAAKAASGRVVAWASRRIEGAEAAAQAQGAPFGRLEDGFVRSVGLGSAFVAPLSLVLDESGVYYDPSRPSDLETILNAAEIPPDLIARAAALRGRLVAESLTKYNVGSPSAPVVPQGAFGVLVPGQVEDDASILKGAGAVRTNRDLLAAVRARRPDAFIVYKPHPDVVAGYRVGAVDDAALKTLADAVVVGGSIAPLYAECRAVETMTSLSGFEALLRGLEVTTHGQPFYAGWGLTEDLAPHSRRGRARTLDELVAAALILYPLYCDPETRLPCGPESALDRLVEQRALAAAPTGRLAARLRHAYALTRHRLLGPIARRLP